MIQVGGIYLVYVSLTDPPKDKFCLCLTTDAWLFFINSRVHPYIASRPVLSSQQISLPSKTHKFLKYDSWIDCSDPISISAVKIDQQCATDPSRFKGLANESVLAAVLLSVASSSTLPQKKKDKIAAALAPPK